MNKIIFKLLVALFIGNIIGGCVAVKTFPNNVRAGETAVISAGWKHHFSANNITVTITPSVGVPIVYWPGNPAIRGVVNFYPDPLSSILVSKEIGQNITFNALTYEFYIANVFTNGDRDWWQTSVYVDLPTTLPLGPATIDITNPEGESVSSVVQIIDGIGSPDEFDGEFVGVLGSDHIAAMARVDNYSVSLNGSTVPYAAQLKLSHSAASTHVVNPRGDIKNVSWSDNSGILNIIVTPAKGALLSDMKDFKIYIYADTGPVTINTVEAFDIDGNIVPGVTATIEFFKGI